MLNQQWEISKTTKIIQTNNIIMVPRNVKPSWLASMFTAVAGALMGRGFHGVEENHVEYQKRKDALMRGAEKFEQDAKRYQREEGNGEMLTRICRTESLRRSNIKRRKAGLKPLDYIPAGCPGSWEHMRFM
jgi:hypothetical protein